MPALLDRIAQHPLNGSELDNANADKRIFRVVNKHGEEVGRIFSDTAPVCNGLGCYPARCAPGECLLKPAEACTEIGAEPNGQPRTSPLIRAWLTARRWLF